MLPNVVRRGEDGPHRVYTVLLVVHRSVPVALGELGPVYSSRRSPSAGRFLWARAQC